MVSSKPEGFVSGPALSCRRCRETQWAVRPAICMRSKPDKPHVGASRNANNGQSWKRGLVTAFAVAASLMGGVPAGRAAPSNRNNNAVTTTQTKKTRELRYDGKQELEPVEKAISYLLTGGTFAILTAWAWRRNREDDALEQIRIKEEVERLEKLKAEFMDVEEDDDSMDDEDLLAALNKRISKDAEDSQDGEDADAGPEAVPGDGDSAPDSTPKSSADTGTATLERPSNSSPTDKDDTPSDAESVDMLRRMWEATDGDSKGDEGKKPNE